MAQALLAGADVLKCVYTRYDIKKGTEYFVSMQTSLYNRGVYVMVSSEELTLWRRNYFFNCSTSFM